MGLSENLVSSAEKSVKKFRVCVLASKVTSIKLYIMYLNDTVLISDYRYCEQIYFELSAFEIHLYIFRANTSRLAKK
jgi:hypothetical protein